MTTVITLLGWNRPKYTKIVLSALAQCWGVEKYDIIVLVEGGGDPEVERLFREINFAKSVTVEVNPIRLGVNFSTLLALRAGFERADTVIHFEDDVVPGQDCLEYFEQALTDYEHDEQVKHISAYSMNREIPDLSDYYSRMRSIFFHPWGIALWKHKFEQDIAPYWVTEAFGPRSWDTWYNEEVVQKRDYYEIQPILSRVQNIGAEGGIHVLSADWHYNNQRTPFWVENVPRVANKDHFAERKTA